MRHEVTGLLLSNMPVGATCGGSQKFLRVYVTGAEKASDLSETQIARAILALRETADTMELLLRGRE